MKIGAILSIVCITCALMSCRDDAPSPVGQPEQPAASWFKDHTAESGVAFEHQSGHVDRFHVPEIMSGGVALVDVDGDDDLDLYLVQSGSVLSAPGENPPNALYLNDGTGVFARAPDDGGAGDRGYGIGVATGDYDNDADVDLLVTNVGVNALLRNDGQGRFTDVSASAGLTHDDYSASATFFDSDGDGDLDLYVCNYLNWTPDSEIDCLNSLNNRDYCAPIAYEAPASDRFYVNNGDGTFVDASETSGISALPGTGLGVVATDFSGDGKADLFVANDGMHDRLWINQGENRFVDRAMIAGTAMDMSGKAKAGMGVTTDDIDNDGDQDVLVCNLWRETDSLFVNQGDGAFRDATTQFGLAATPKTFTRFGIGLADFDNDGTLDLYQANGRVAKLARTWADDPYAEPNLLFRGIPGARTIRFTEITPRGGAGDQTHATSRGAAFGDINNDGALDIVVANRDAAPHILVNAAPHRGNWITFRVLDAHGSDALGAVVTVTSGEDTWTKVVRSDGSYCAANDPRVHLGLGDRETIDRVVVTWPTGQTRAFEALEANTITTLGPTTPLP